MKVERLTNKHFDDIFKELVKEKSHYGCVRGFCVISTFDFAIRLWKKHHIAYKKEAKTVRSKMREWWNSYKWKSEPIFHKMICGIAVSLASPMSYDYCVLEKRGLLSKSLITIYQNQKRFFESGGS